MSDYNLEYYKYLKYKSKYLELLNIYNELYGGKDEVCDSDKIQYSYKIVNDKLYFCMRHSSRDALFLCDWNYLVEKKKVQTRNITITHEVKKDETHLTIKFPKKMLEKFYTRNNTNFYNHVEFINKMGLTRIDPLVSWENIRNIKLELLKNKKKGTINVRCLRNTSLNYNNLDLYYLDTNYKEVTRDYYPICEEKFTYEVDDNRLYLLVSSATKSEGRNKYLGIYLCDWDYLVYKKDIILNFIKIMYEETAEDIKISIYTPMHIPSYNNKSVLFRQNGDENTYSVSDTYIGWNFSGQSYSFVTNKDKKTTCTLK